MGFIHKFLGVRSGSSVTKEPKTVATTTLCRASNDEYEVTDQCMGEGSFAEVKLTRRRRDGKVFALKMFSRNAVDTRKVHAEFYVARRLRHKNIIATLELYTLDSSFGILMEYATTCLFDLVSSFKLRPGDSERYLADLVSGVEYIHRLGFVHRDLKLENVVVGVDGYAKVIDFGTIGLAKPGPTSKFAASRHICLDSDSSSVNTGSSAYMAPELFIDSKYDPVMADVWSLGIVYICMALGRFAWTVAKKPNAGFAAYACADVGLPASDSTLQSDMSLQSLPSLIRQLPPKMQNVVHSMLRVQRTKRSNLAAVSERISRIQNQQKELSNRASAEAVRLLQSGEVSNEHLSLSETYLTKTSWGLSGETLCRVIEVTE